MLPLTDPQFAIDCETGYPKVLIWACYYHFV
jgi:hypothetical protein